jgi:hypothetical protein
VDGFNYDWNMYENAMEWISPRHSWKSRDLERLLTGNPRQAENCKKIKIHLHSCKVKVIKLVSTRFRVTLQNNASSGLPGRG